MATNCLVTIKSFNLRQARHPQPVRQHGTNTGWSIWTYEEQIAEEKSTLSKNKNHLSGELMFAGSPVRTQMKPEKRVKALPEIHGLLARLCACVLSCFRVSHVNPSRHVSSSASAVRTSCACVRFWARVHLLESLCVRMHWFYCVFFFLV